MPLRMWVLVLNAGSSSLKFALIETERGTRPCEGAIDALDSARPSTLTFQHAGQASSQQLDLTGHAEALARVAHCLQGPLEALSARGEGTLEAVAHRVVHGGERFREAVRIDAAVEEALEALSSLAPLHNPPALAGIRAAVQAFGDLPQVAVFDTAFHQSLPPLAYRYAVPEAWYRDLGVRKYGFHGTSVRFVSESMAVLSPLARRLIVAHLGNGCSLTAVADGKSCDTTMGLTPLAGVVMGTRCGDIDPGLTAYLARRGVDVKDVDHALNHASGLFALSGGESDVRELEAQALAGEGQARFALEVFADRVAKAVASLTVSLGGLDALCFAGGIGEHGSAMRTRIVARLAFLGLQLDASLNAARVSRAMRIDQRPATQNLGANVAGGGGAEIWVVPTDEAVMIAKEAAQVLNCSARG